MGYGGTRNLDVLLKFESIRGEKISEKDRAYLEKIAISHNVLSIELKSPANFSKPKTFFIHGHKKFLYLRDGKWLPYANINEDNKYFLAYKIQKQKMFIWGYFPGEFD